MTSNLKEKLREKINTGTRQEATICARLIKEENLVIKNLDDFSNIFNCSNSSVTRLSRSLGFPSFKHFFYELFNNENRQLKHQNNDLIWYKNSSIEVASFLKGKLFIFTSRRAKSVGKFFHERLNDANISNEYYHESWGKSIHDEVQRITPNDTTILITMNGASNIANNVLNELTNNPKVNTIIFLTANEKIKSHPKIKHFSISKIDGIHYQVDTFDGYNLACLRMIGFFVSLLSEIYNKRNKFDNKYFKP